jgi:hypothetical protein
VFCCEAWPRGKRGREGGVVKYVHDGDEHSVEKRREEKRRMRRMRERDWGNFG